MRKNLLKEGHWERHGDYWILHDELGRAVGMLIQFKDKETEKELGKSEQLASQVRRIGG